MAEDTAKAGAVERVTAVHAALVRAIFQYNSRAWLDLDLTMQQLKVLLVLHFQGRHTITALADTFGVKLPTVTGVVDRLVEHGLVQREADAGDRRVVWVRLTEAGETMLGELQAANVNRIWRILPRLSQDELAALETGLAALKAAVENDLVEKANERNGFPTLVPAASLARAEHAGG